MPIYFPPLPGTVDDAETILAGQVFRRDDLSELRLPSVQEFLSLNTGTASNPDDENNIVAVLVFTP